ncbi:hypothetical protein AX16_007935 [Volvariella volvacea WC 439]|nr:hypothetical protein AX16_007935 [Volvariella volvacea WC 439]
MSPSPISKWSTVPEDILLQITNPYTLAASEARFEGGNPIRVPYHTPREGDHAKAHALSQFRLVCKHWYLILTPVLYQRTIVRVHPTDTQYQEAFKHHPDLIQHLIVNVVPYYRWRHLTFQPDLLQACLAECNSIHTLELIGMSVPSPTYEFALLGLGKLCDGLTTLEIWGGGYKSYMWGDGTGSQTRCQRWGLPQSLPNISRLALSCLGFFPRFFEGIISRIRRQVRTTDGSKTIITPLRELVLDGQIGLLHNDWVARVLQINNISKTLTVFELSVPWDQLIDYNRRPDYEGLPLEIIEKCRSLVSFRYYAHFTTKIFTRLSDTTSELGIRIVSPLEPDIPPNALIWFPDTIVTRIQQIIDFVQSPALRKGVNSIIVGWRWPDEAEWSRLKEACAREGVAVEMLP